VFRSISDKAAVLDAARRIGIQTPDEWRIEAAGRRPDLHLLRFPIAIKPSRSVSDAGEHRIKLGVSYARDERELEEALAGIPLEAYPVLLQRRVDGPGVGIFLLNWAGVEIAAFSHRRLREKPPSGGVSVYRESIAADPTLLSLSRALLAHFGWEGVAMVEYKLDRDGTAYLMEVNGRFWGSLQLAIDAGVDFPRLLVEATSGSRSPTPVQTYHTGIRSRWWWGDVDHLLARLRRSPATLSLPPGSPSRTRAVLAFLRLRRGDRNEILRLDDPWPFARETLDRLVGRAP
jgi:predicted ATP-grasp superfamily ATP-dependent carboligase